MSAITAAPRAILGPLTTTFTPPPPCSVGLGWCSTCNVIWYGQTCVPTGVQDGTACWPTTSQGAPAPSPTLQGWGFYSPGLVCPAGYSSACTATAGGTTDDWTMQFRMTAGETAVGCCPAGFRCHNLNGQTCISIATSATISTVTCKSGTSDGFAWATAPNAALKVSSYNVFAPMIQIAWQASDRSVSTSSGSTSTPTKSGGSSSVAAGSGSASTTLPGGASTAGGGGPVISSAASESPASGLSGGAIAGISIGIALVILGIIAAAAFVWWKKRQQSQRLGSRGGLGELPASTAWPKEVEPATKQYYAGEKPMELSGVRPPRYEAPGRDLQPQELPTS